MNLKGLLYKFLTQSILQSIQFHPILHYYCGLYLYVKITNHTFLELYPFLLNLLYFRTQYAIFHYLIPHKQIQYHYSLLIHHLLHKKLFLRIYFANFLLFFLIFFIVFFFVFVIKNYIYIFFINLYCLWSKSTVYSIIYRIIYYFYGLIVNKFNYIGA